MSKLSFRARALDASKPMPVFRSEEIPDLPDFAAINRAVPQMPTGMEKEEECEHHLQRAISAQQAFGHTGELVIPTPEVFSTPEDMYETMYPANYKFPRQLIHMQPFSMDQDIPDYDMDSEDEKWLNQQAKKMDITSLQFEEMMDRLEKSSGQQVITLKEAKLLLKEDDDLIIAVYDYWLNKRLKTQLPLIPQVKTEKRDGSTNNNPYVAFRRRVEKMQTRKNRKNDEASYEKMLKLRRDLSRAVTLLEMVKRREKTKREHLHLTIEIFEKRYQVGDFSGQILAEVSAMKHTRPTFVPVNNNQVILKPDGRVPKQKNEETAPRKKREYTKRKKQEVPSVSTSQVSCSRIDMDANYSDLLTSEDEGLSPATSPSDVEDENDPDGPYAFRRKKYCNYHAPLIERLGSWPWCSPEDGGLGDKRYRYCLTSLSHPTPRCIGFARRRIGRGGRILLDRAWTPLDDYWADLDFTITHSLPNGLPSSNEFLSEIKNEWLHFRPQSPQGVESECADGSSSFSLAENHSAPEVVDDYSRNCEPTDVDFESFQNHQEELFEMQRKQLEKLKQEELYAESSHNNPEHSSSFQASSQFTLDSASVQFAVSAVLNASDVSGILNSLVTVPTSSSASAAPASTVTNSLSGVERSALTNGPTEPVLEVDVGCSKESSRSFSLGTTTTSSSSSSSSASPFVVHPSAPLLPSSDSIVEVSLASAAGNVDSSVTSVRTIPSTEQQQQLNPGNSIFFGDLGSGCVQQQSPCLIPVKTVSHFVNVDHRFLREQNGNQDTGTPQSSLPLTRVKVEKVAVSDTNVAMDVT